MYTHTNNLLFQQGLLHDMKYTADRDHPLEEFQPLINLNAKLGSQEFKALRQSRKAT